MWTKEPEWEMLIGPYVGRFKSQALIHLGMGLGLVSKFGDLIQILVGYGQDI